MSRGDFSTLREKIVNVGLCTGCGTCAGICPIGCIDFDYENEEPILVGPCNSCGLCNEVCPGMDIPLLKMEKHFFGENRTSGNEYLGVHRKLLKGYARDSKIRKRSASGGLTSSLLLYALRKNIIDRAIVTVMDQKDPWRVRPQVASTAEQIMEAAKSKYSICPNNSVLREVGENSRVAIVGLPCHVHGVRKLQLCRELSNLGNRIIFILGIFCGCNTSYRVTEHVIAEFSDIELARIGRVEYRGGDTSQDMTIYTQDGNEITIRNAERVNTYCWLFRDRCRMCCDWTAELADVSLGDIFYPHDKGLWHRVPNWNSLIVRTKIGEDLVKGAEEEGMIELASMEEEAFYGNVGFEAKKHGAVYKLMERKRYGWPTPSYDCEFTWKPRRRKTYSVPK